MQNGTRVDGGNRFERPRRTAPGALAGWRDPLEHYWDELLLVANVDPELSHSSPQAFLPWFCLNGTNGLGSCWFKATAWSCLEVERADPDETRVLQVQDSGEEGEMGLRLSL